MLMEVIGRSNKFDQDHCLSVIKIVQFGCTTEIIMFDATFEIKASVVEK